MNLSENKRRAIARTVAFAFRDGVWSSPEMAARATYDLGLPLGHALDNTLVLLADSSTVRFEHPPNDAPRDFASFIAQAITDLSPKEIAQLAKALIARPPARVGGLLQQTMGERRWPVPEIDDEPTLGRFLRLNPSELAWYADVRSMERTVTSENLRHYDYRWSPKASGGSRLLEAPKQNLKAVQRQVHRDILRAVPVHSAAHGFCRRRSIHTYAAPHAGRAVVARFDLADFFGSVQAGRVFAIFRSMGYPEGVAHKLTGLATNAVPIEVVSSARANVTYHMQRRLSGPHLPQGAPTSPALANLAAFGLDRRLSALAATLDGRYTRYADDLAFSSDKHGIGSHRFGQLVKTIVADEGFALNRAKTSVRDRSQRQTLTGLVVNQHPNVHRRDYDRLRAVLHDAAVNGPAMANRRHHPEFRAHLEGRIGFVQATNPARARKLWLVFDRIQW